MKFLFECWKILYEWVQRTSEILFNAWREILYLHVAMKYPLFTNFSLVSVIQALVALIHDPEPEHPLRGDLAEEYIKDRKKFNKTAEEFTKKYAEKRPADWTSFWICLLILRPLQLKSSFDVISDIHCLNASLTSRAQLFERQLAQTQG